VAAKPSHDQTRYSKRHADILRIVREDGTTSISALARQLAVSAESIRRDVKPLTETGALVRVHGAVSLPHHLFEAPFDRRMRENAEAKRLLARYMAAKIENDDTLMLDTGTTTSILARELLSKTGLTVITNSPDIARTLATVNGNTVFMAGGELRGDNGAAFGPTAIDFIRNFRVRHAIISIGAIDAQTGPMDYDLGEAQFAKAVLAQGDQATILTDHTKLGRGGLVKVCEFTAFDTLITDKNPAEDVLKKLSEAGTAVEIPGTISA
jgi:DeoR family glycerol-3-phosphate regulon repressor